MFSDFLSYRESDDIYFSVKRGDFVTFLGKLNTHIYNNVIYKNSNNFMMVNYNKISSKNYVDKLYSLIKVASYDFIDSFETETVFTELAYNLESLGMKVNDIKDKVSKLSNILKLPLNVSPYSLSNSKKALLLIGCSLISEPKMIVIDNLLEVLDKSDYEIACKVLKEYVNNENIVLNFTNNVEESLLGNFVYVSDDKKIVMFGKTMSVLNEEKIMKRLGINLPFIVLLNKYLIDYNLIDNYILDYTSLGGALWK